ncbi:MAG: acyl-CoA dehydrogenase family protein, partial [Nitratireductor sp.]
MYRSPVSKIKDTLFAITELKSDMSNASFGDLSEDVLEAILEEAGKFASERIAPLNKISDTMGASLKDGEVTLPTGFKQTYKDWVNAGWNSLSAPQEFGGQGLPLSLAVSAIEMWSGACQSFTLGPVLTLGAIEAIDNHGSEELKAMFGEQITSGEWAATMNLTEPQAGTDLAALKAKAEAVGDGTYKISGQ